MRNWPRPGSRAVGWFTGFLLILTAGSSAAQDRGQITGASLAPPDSLRLIVEPLLPNPDILLLESADSPLGPWWKEPEFKRTPVPKGYEFLTALKPYWRQRYFRFGLFSQTRTLTQTLPYIRFISPNSGVRPGLPVTLMGANFAPSPSDNTVRFEAPGESWTAAVTEAATNYLIAIAPTNLPSFGSSTGDLYRVTVTTAQGTGNGVGCNILQTSGNTFMIRPRTAHITQPPGSGKQTLTVGGGVPPYRLVPQTTGDLAIAAVGETDHPALD